MPLALCSLGYSDGREDSASIEGDHVLTLGEPLRLDIVAKVTNLIVVNDAQVSLWLDTVMTNSSSVAPATVTIEMTDGSGYIMGDTAVTLDPGETSELGRLNHDLDCLDECEHDIVITIRTEAEQPLDMRWGVDLWAIGSPRHGCFTRREAKPSVSLDVSAN